MSVEVKQLNWSLEMLVFGQSTQRKTSQSKERTNLQQTQPTYDAGSVCQTHIDTLLAGECSQHSAPLFSKLCHMRCINNAQLTQLGSHL